MADKAALMEGNTTEARAPGEGLSAAQLIEEAKKTQAEDSAALDRMARMVGAPHTHRPLHPTVFRAR